MNQPSGPLAGLRVIEFSGIGPGPHVAMLLADLGAEVVRIDRPGAVVSNPVVERARHRVGIDLKSEEGKAFCLDAVARADVLIEGFRPGVMERLGLGPEELLASNPRLIYARMTGWGQDGPLAQAAGHDINYIAITGALSAVGKAGETATPPQNLVGDFGGGSMYCAFGIMAALYERERSGKGQVVDAAIVDGATSLMSFFFGVRGRPFITTERGKGMLGGAAHFYRCFKCADGKEISLGAIESQFYAELLARAGAPEELAQGQMNPANWDHYADKLAALFATKTQAEWCELLEGTDACFAPVLELDEARDHPHMQARGAYVQHEGEWHTAPAPRFSRTPGAVRSSADDGADVVARWTAGS
ncbi:CaiB/BaiF CoA transferase family protein [Erythrobacter dokdonensis]|uniref:L-carnitine dehydratase/bile acid-inducible protein F n=1 Tax=Erythrobacter dokdonensis DSW-74 TaxID=1300349 RepID=A0A1A7BFG2_9SPHN|nr:CaiB/BaiF CoA-transferase family protein [Erythrobacter dokdonensis]OBV11229.1 L-carnitine dehydratase/bile acid-inducible protein F [Erythrobacter dokdonensis DSW-74]